MQPRNKQDFWSGIMFILLGVGFAWKATSYQMGTAARMGPGYFPFWLGTMLALLGILVLLKSFSKKAEATVVTRFEFRILALVIGAVVIYAYLLPILGLFVCTFILVFISSMAAHDFSLKVTIINGLCLVVFVYFAFIRGLGLIFPLWPSIFGMN